MSTIRLASSALNLPMVDQNTNNNTKSEIQYAVVQS